MTDTYNNFHILNLTQHAATPAQIEAGVVEPDPITKVVIHALLTFTTIPDFVEIQERAEALADILNDSGYRAAMIGGAPYLMGPLEETLRKRGEGAVYAFSVRESKEEDDGSGGVRKTTVFRHLGFVEAAP